MRHRQIAMALWATFGVGCGFKKEIESLESLLAAREGVLEQREEQIKGLEADKHALEGEVARLQAILSDLEKTILVKEKDIATLDAQLSEERNKSARMLADRSARQAEIDSMKQAMAELAERKRQAEERVQQFKDLVSRFQSLIDAGTLDVRMVDGRMVVVMATDILFASGSAELSKEGKDALAQVAAILATMTDKHFQVEGHTDNVPIASARYPNNWYLASARAIGVVEHLVASGMGMAQLSAAAYGDTRPVADNNDKALRAANRRIEIVVVPDLSTLPGYEELNKL